MGCGKVKRKKKLRAFHWKWINCKYSNVLSAGEQIAGDTICQRGSLMTPGTGAPTRI